MRTFTRGDDRFWTIDRKSLSVTVAFGKVGGKAQTRKTVARPEAAARQLYQRMIREKRKEGYVETTPPPAPLAGTGLALESALVDNPDDTAAHMVLADWLSEQDDPILQARGEFIRVQLALENPKLPAAERGKLQKREKQLLKDYERDWLGHQLSDYLFDAGGDDLYVSLIPPGFDAPRDYRRGWLSRLVLPVLTPDLAAAMAGAPALRLLNELVIDDVLDVGDPLAPLAKAKNLTNIRNLTLNAVEFQGPASDLVANLPRIEEVYITTPDIGKLFSLPNLARLRILHVIEVYGYPIRELASNPSLGRLQELLLSPPGLQEDDEPYLRLASVRALVRSKLLPSIRSLALHRSDMGDAGCREIADSGILGRLESLDLTLGCIRDEGARILASAKDYAHLKKLSINGNRLTEVGIAALERKGLELIASEQQVPDSAGRYDDAYLYDEEDYDPYDYDEDLQDGEWE